MTEHEVVQTSRRIGQFQAMADWIEAHYTGRRDGGEDVVVVHHPDQYPQLLAAIAARGCELEPRSDCHRSAVYVMNRRDRARPGSNVTSAYGKGGKSDA